MNSEDALMMALFLGMLHCSPKSTLSEVIGSLCSISICLYMVKLFRRNIHIPLWRRVRGYLKDNAEDVIHVLLVAVVVVPYTSSVKDVRILAVVFIVECFYRRIRLFINRKMQALKRWKRPSEQTQTDSHAKDNILLTELKCPVCTETVQPPIRLCVNGHNICNSCRQEQTQTDSLARDHIFLTELKCPVCTETMQPPIRLCVNGHNICNSCRPQLDSCPTCRGSLLKIRNKAMENIARLYCGE